MKTKANKLLKKLQQTGGAGPSEDDDGLQELSQIEKRVLQIIGRDFSGDGKTKELPIIQVSIFHH